MQETASRVSAESILEYLTWAEQNEPDVWLRDDYRIAWITVVKAARGESFPHVMATYTVLGVHPEQVWSRILARRRAKLGTVIWEASFPPKKPVVSERLSPRKNIDAA